MVMSEPKFFSTKGCGLSSGPHPFILSSRGSLFPDKTDLWNSPPASSSPVNHTPTIASGSPSSFRVWVLLGLSFPVKSGFMQWRVCTLNFPSSPFFPPSETKPFKNHRETWKSQAGLRGHVTAVCISAAHTRLAQLSQLPPFVKS